MFDIIIKFYFLIKTCFLSIYTVIKFLIKKKNIKKIQNEIEKHGPVFIKMAQWFSIRNDIFNKEIIDTLENVRDNVPFHSWKYSEKIIKNELTQGSLYIYNKNSIGSGSLAQVYEGYYNPHIKSIFSMKNNSINIDKNNYFKVIVKILHPNINYKIDADISYIKTILKIPIKTIQKINRTTDLEPFFNSIRKQTNFNLEKNNAIRIKKNFEKIPKIHVPNIYFVSENIIIEEFCEGIVFEKFIISYPNHIQEAYTLVNWMMRKMVLNDGFIHCDLHNGNILYRLYNNEVYLSLIDFGLTEELSEDIIKKSNDFMKYMFIPNEIAQIDILLSFMSYDDINKKNKIKQLLINKFHIPEETVFKYLVDNNINLKQISKFSPKILKYICNIENFDEETFKHRFEFGKMLNEISDIEVKFDYFKLMTFIMIDGIITSLAKNYRSSNSNIIEYYEDVQYKLKYGHYNKFYNLDTDKWY